MRAPSPTLYRVKVLFAKGLLIRLLAKVIVRECFVENLSIE